MTCPTGYELRTVEGAQRCVYTLDPTISVRLVPQPAVQRKFFDFTMFSIDDIDHASDEYVRYSTEKTRFDKEVENANASINHRKAVDAAGAAVLAAGGNNSTANEAYVELTGGHDALEAQYATEIAANTKKFVSDYQFLDNQSMQQQRTLDIIKSVKDNLFTVKDDMEYSVGTFGKQVSDIRNQININRRTRQQATDYGKWLGVGLNFAIVLALLFMLFVVGRKVLSTTNFMPSSSGPLGAPARPPASEHTVELLKGLTGLLSASATPAKKG